MIVNLPKFFVIGPPHGGIAWLTKLLQAHGQIYLPQQQNLNYFSNDDFYRKGIGYYYSLFSQAHEGLIKGDVAPDYLLYPDKVLKRLRFLYNGDMRELRFVVYLKNPVVRLLDDYLNNRDSGLEELPLERAIEREQELLSNAMFTRKGMSLGLYLNSSRYHSLLKPWLSVFHPDQFYVITDLDLQENSTRTIEGVFKFLGVDANYAAKRNYERAATRDATVLDGLKKFFLKDLLPTVDNNKESHGMPLNGKRTRMEEARIPYHVSELLYSEVADLEQLLGQNLTRWFSSAPGVYAV